MSTLGERLKLIRKKQFNPRKLGKIFGLTKYSISLYENNKTSQVMILKPNWLPTLILLIGY